MESAMPAKTRLCHMDLLKCLAIYFVLMFHGTLYPNWVLPDMPLSQLLRYFSRTILSTCVPLFFFVNGYLLMGRPLDLKKHTRKTLKLMAITCFWILFLLVILQGYYREPLDFSAMGQRIWDLKDGWNNQLWYMNVLMGIYLVFPLLKTTYDSNRPAFYWFTAVMAVLVFGSDCLDLGVTLFDLFVKKEFSLHYNNFPLFKHFTPFTHNAALGLAYFCLGGTAASVEHRLADIPSRLRTAGAAAGLVLCCAMLGVLGWRFSLYLNGLWDTVWNGYDTVFTLGNVLCLYLLSLGWKRDIPLVRLISANTLGIYLLHDLLHKQLGPVAAGFDAMRTLPGTMLYTAVLLLLTLGVCLILKKLPLAKHLIS